MRSIQTRFSFLSTSVHAPIHFIIFTHQLDEWSPKLPRRDERRTTSQRGSISAIICRNSNRHSTSPAIETEIELNLLPIRIWLLYEIVLRVMSIRERPRYQIARPFTSFATRWEINCDEECVVVRIYNYYCNYTIVACNLNFCREISYIRQCVRVERFIPKR